MTQTLQPASAVVVAEGISSNLRHVLGKLAQMDGDLRRRRALLCRLLQKINMGEPAPEGDPDFCGVVWTAFADTSIYLARETQRATNDRKRFLAEANYYFNRATDVWGADHCPALRRRIDELGSELAA